VALLGLWGAFAYLAALVPRDLALDVTERLNTLRVSALVLAIVTTIMALPLETAMIGDGWNDALNTVTLRAVLFETSVGHAWQIQGGAAVLLAATLWMPVRARRIATAAAAGLALIALTFTGHAVMREGWLGAAHRFNDGLHLLSGGAWFGALVPLLPILRAFDDPKSHRAAGLALRRFSAAGHGAVALVIATGILNTALVLGRWPLDWTSPYQALLAIKVVLVLTMVALALLNRYVVVPRLAPHSGSAARIIRDIAITEIVLGAMVIGLVSAFGLLEPA
jgi:putative copper resistance protein D